MSLLKFISVSFSTFRRWFSSNSENGNHGTLLWKRHRLWPTVNCYCQIKIMKSAFLLQNRWPVFFPQWQTPNGTASYLFKQRCNKTWNFLTFDANQLQYSHLMIVLEQTKRKGKKRWDDYRESRRRKDCENTLRGKGDDITDGSTNKEIFSQGSTYFTRSQLRFTSI